ncbi:exonuclease domain-containing protein [Robertkochia sediminum]|uniref:exonuclease domain-containing protein n=1 Tax=Robertkochia sediminum TaxID=2785326 RepID=UPI00193488B5|nr:exonuclease domain-containing protein [Robertkochia sediminum]MBL7473415.1 exonuclease [Robertkochia sediminum]
MYAILDIETTGGKYNEEGITEIAIYRYDGHEVTDQFISLVNPEKEIQPFVVKLTGINNNMLKTAPKFHEVAKRIVEITEDCILVAHNAQFDYRILQTEFRRLGYDYQRRSLCTVELSQTLMPEQPSYSLGKLVRSLGIPVSDRHRANGDAVATLKLFKVLLNKDTHKEILKSTVRTASTGILSQRLLDIVEEMPSVTGLYYMHDNKGEVIFIERSNNLKKSVNKRFTSASKRSRNLQKAVRAVTYEETGTELIAALKEEEELQTNKPKFNRRKKVKAFKYVLTEQKTDKGYISLRIEPYHGQNDYVTSFSTYPEAYAFLAALCKTHNLCLKVNGLSEARAHCSAYDDKTCYGACMNEEDAASYNARTLEAINNFTTADRDLIITGKGRAVDEKSALLVENGKITGYAFVNLNHQLHSPEVIRNLVSPLTHNKQSRHIVERYLRRHKNIQKILF